MQAPKGTSQHRPLMTRGEDEQAEANRLTVSLAGMAFALLLVVVGLFLVQHLESKARLEDCLMSGQMNCDALLPGR